MQTSGNTNKSPIKLSAVNKVICLRMEKTNTAKSPLGDFKVTTPEIPLLSQQAVTSKWILVPYINLQLNHYPSIQLDLFYSDNFSFWSTTLSTWLTNYTDPSTRLQSPTREGCWLQSSSVHQRWRSRRCLVTKPTVHKHSNFFTRTMN